MRSVHFGLALTWCLLIGCRNQPLNEIISTAGGQVAAVVNDPGRYQARIVYVQINRDAQNRPRFTTHTYGVPDSREFNPAGTVHFPVAVLAFEKLDELGVKPDDHHVRMRFDSVRETQTRMLIDPSSPTGVPNPGHFLHQIGVAGDHEAYNRLFEFLGQDEIYERLKRRDFGMTRILTRLGTRHDPAENDRCSNPMSIYVHDTLTYQRDEVCGTVVHPVARNTYRNTFALSDQVRFLTTLMFPESVPDSMEFCLPHEGYRLIYQALAALPRESRFPLHDSIQKADGYRKFFMVGDPQASLPGHIRIFNMSGYADGQMTDCAYLVDFMHQIEFIIAATVQPGTSESGPEELEVVGREIGRPFFGQLAQAVYAYELERERRYKPDLSDLQNMLNGPQQ